MQHISEHRFAILAPIAVAVLLMGGLCIAVFSPLTGGLTSGLTIDVGTVSDTPFINDAFAPETTDSPETATLPPTTFRWSSPETRITFPGVPLRRGIVKMRLFGKSTPDALGTSHLSHPFSHPFRGHASTAYEVAPNWRTYHILLPLDSDGISPFFALNTPSYCPPPHDSRVLGVPIDWVSLTPVESDTWSFRHLLLQTSWLTWLFLLLSIGWWRISTGNWSLLTHPAPRSAVVGVAGVVAIGMGEVAMACMAPWLLMWATPWWAMVAATVVVGGWWARESRVPHWRGVHSLWQRIYTGRAPLLFLLIGGVIAHILLFAPLPLSMQGTAGLVLLGLPGVFLSRLLFWEERHPLVRLFLAICGAEIVIVLLMLILQAIPGPLPWWGLLLVVDALTIGLFISAWRRCPIPPYRLSAAVPLPFIAILIGGGLLRLLFLGTSEFEGDEARALLMGVGLMHGHDNILMLHKKGPVEILLPAAPMVLTQQLNEWVARLPLAIASLGALVGIFVLARELIAFQSPSSGSPTSGSPTSGSPTSVSPANSSPSSRLQTAIGANGPLIGLIAAAILTVDGFLLAYARIVQYQSIVVLMMIGAVWAMYRFLTGDRHLYRTLAIAALMGAIALLAHYDGIFVLPVLVWLMIVGGWWRGWRRLNEWARGIGVVAAVGGGITLGFYVPFVLHDHFQGTISYLGQRTGGEEIHQAFLFNNLPDYYTIATFYNTTYQMQALGAILAIALIGWLLVYSRPRVVGRGLALLLGGSVGLLLMAPHLFTLPGESGNSWAICGFGLPIMGLILSPATPSALRVVLIWFAPPFLAESFLIAEPKTHFYTMDAAAALLIGIGVAQAVQWAHRTTLPRVKWAVPRLLALAGAALLAVSFFYLGIVFVRQMPEYKRMFPAARPALFQAGYGDTLPRGGHYGHPHRDGWKVIGELYRTGALWGSYYSNQMGRISGWYTRGAYRCSEKPDTYLLGTWAASESDMAIPTEQIREEYQRTGCVVVEQMNMMDIYRKRPQVGIQEDDPPRVFHLENAIADFDRQPIVPFPIQQPLMEPLPQHMLNVTWESGLTLVGYDVHPPTTEGWRANTQPFTTTLTLVWQPSRPQPEGYEVVVSIHDGNKVGIAQPLCRVSPPSEWSIWYATTTPFSIAPSYPHSSTIHIGIHNGSTNKWLPSATGERSILIR